VTSQLRLEMTGALQLLLAFKNIGEYIDEIKDIV
jgi:hypothetical protein